MSKTLTTKEFIEKANNIHKNKYDYSDVNYINNHTKIKILCKIHGLFYQIPKTHLINQGCPKCGIETSNNYRKSNKEEFIKKAKKIHGKKFNYFDVDYKNTYTDVIIICPKHGKFLQTPNNHLQGNGCNKCRYENLKSCQPKSISIFVKEANQKHNNLFNYSKSNYINSNKKIEIICSKHGSFFQTPNHHLQGNGCPRCKHTISKFEKDFLNYLKIPDTKENRQVCILKKRVDGLYKNTIYEYLGDFWHGNLEKFNSTEINKWTKTTFGELNKNTFKRFEYIKNLGYKIKYIWENDWKKFNDGKDLFPKIQAI